MQADTITLAVDELNNSTTVDHVYTKFDPYHLNRTVYIYSAHTPIMRDMLALYRTPLKSSGNFAGVMKTAVKFTQDIEVPGVDTETTLVAPIIYGASWSIPLGATDAQILLARQRQVALLDLDSVMVDLNSKQEI